MGKLFGTDGLRGKAADFPLDNATCELMGRVLFFLLQDRKIDPELIVGRDTRESGPSIFSALCRGFSRAGGQVDDGGILSTPAIAYLAKKEKKCAISITASHNPYDDNGIKIFGPDGYKISEAAELELEPYLLGEKPFLRKVDSDHAVQAVDRKEEFRKEYCDYLTQELFAGLNLQGMKVALDCANGALYEIAGFVIRRLGAEVLAWNTQPDGRNINLNCGSLHPEVLFEGLKSNDCDCGFTFDGDGDRCLAADKNGMYDGDYILAAGARYLQRQEKLKKNTVVATSMSNLGLEVFLRDQGISLLRVPVGDKNVLEKLESEELSLGGEQSGHVIFMNETFIGDGLLTALQLLRFCKSTGASLSHLCDGFVKYPQVLINIPVKRKPDLESVPEIQDGIASVERELASSGRMVVRYSGTENLARVMIEGPDQDSIQRMATNLGEIIRNKLN